MMKRLNGEKTVVRQTKYIPGTKIQNSLNADQDSGRSCYEEDTSHMNNHSEQYVTLFFKV